MEVFGPGLLSSSAKLSLSLFFAAPRPPNAGAGGALHDDHVHVSSTTVGTATLPTRSNRGSLLSDAVHNVARGSAVRHQLAISLQGQMAADSNSFRAAWRRAVLAPCWIYRATLPLTSGHGSERTILWLIIYPQMNLERVCKAGETAAPVYSQGELPPLASKTVT